MITPKKKHGRLSMIMIVFDLMFDDGDCGGAGDGDGNGNVWDLASATQNVYNTLLMMMFKVGGEVWRCNRGPLTGGLHRIYLQCSGLFQSAD